MNNGKKRTLDSVSLLPDVGIKENYGFTSGDGC
jgi:hypothetical protein